MTLDSGTRCAVSDSADTVAGGTVTITLDGKTVSVPLNAKETLLESARRGGLVPPYSCEAGNCGTCIATVKEGKITKKCLGIPRPAFVPLIVFVQNLGRNSMFGVLVHIDIS